MIKILNNNYEADEKFLFFRKNFSALFSGNLEKD